MPTYDIDITNLVTNMQSTFVTVTSNLAFTAITGVPGLSWLRLPILSSILKSSLSWVLGALANDIMLSAFFLNTAITKASQAQSYVDAVNIKNNLPPDATEADYAKAEQNEIASFNNFVILT